MGEVATLFSNCLNFAGIMADDERMLLKVFVLYLMSIVKGKYVFIFSSALLP
jgi:hypothetical protein